MELCEILSKRTIIDLNNIRLQRRDQEQITPNDSHPITTIHLMGGQQVYHKINGRVRQKDLRVIA
jgi:hypothetical protein